MTISAMHRTTLAGLLAFVACLPFAWIAEPAHAQAATSRAVPKIDGFDVEPVRQATPGSELNFTLYGSPGGTAAVKISGATGDVVLTESEAGVYEGSYTIRRRDTITARSAATANLRLGNRVVSAILDEPLIGIQAKRPAPAVASASAPRIERFEVDPPARLAAGELLILTVTGTPGGTANARIAGVKGKVLLNEIRTGVYEGSYTIRDRDRIAVNAAVTATLLVGTQETSAVLRQTLESRAGYQPSARQAVRVCLNCGVVEAVNTVEVQGDGTYLGKIAGGVVGALLGSQVGSGRGTTVAEVAGAAGGAFAGNEVEKRMKKTTHYEVLVRLENGGTQTVAYAAQPPFAVGSRVKVENSTLVSQ